MVYNIPTMQSVHGIMMLLSWGKTNMKKTTGYILIACLLLFTLLFFNPDRESVKTTDTYTLEDFDSIVVSESTLEDLNRIAVCDQLYVTSFGGVLEYPTEDGHWIRIKIVGANAVVESIEVVETLWA